MLFYAIVSFPWLMKSVFVISLLTMRFMLDNPLWPNDAIWSNDDIDLGQYWIDTNTLPQPMLTNHQWSLWHSTVIKSMFQILILNLSLNYFMITGISLRRQWVNYAVDPDLSGKIQAQTNNELLIRIINSLACVNIPVLRNQGSFNAWSQQRLEYNIILVYIKLLLI